MPTNLPAECFEAEKRFKSAQTSEEKISCLEEWISAIPKHKGTDKLRADLRRRLSKLKTKSQTKKKVSRHESAFQIEKEGCGRVALLGPPNAGKSALLRGLTKAAPKVSEYPYTTWLPTPGMMIFKDVGIQLIDTPPLNRNHMESELFDLIRGADMILMAVDIQADPIEQLEDSTGILVERGIVPAGREGDSPDRRSTFLPMAVAVNKIDSQEQEEDFEVFEELLEGEWTLIPVSATTPHNLEKLKETVFQKLSVIRVYSKPPGKKPELDTPFVLKKGSVVIDFAAKVHKDFLKTLKTARLWAGPRPGQMVSRDHILKDGDIVELQS